MTKIARRVFTGVEKLWTNHRFTSDDRVKLRAETVGAQVVIHGLDDAARQAVDTCGYSLNKQSLKKHAKMLFIHNPHAYFLHYRIQS